MNQKEMEGLLRSAKTNSKKRNFVQSYDVIVSIKGIDLKKTDQHVDFFATLHYSKGKKAKVCALVGPELADDAKKVCDEVILVSDFPKYQEKKAAKNLAQSYDFFIAQANMMAKVAAAFGKVFGPRGKMPNPKVGCVVPPKTNLQALYDKLQKTVRLSIKKNLMIQAQVGNETMDDKEVLDNVKTVYDQIIHHLPNEKNNIKNIYLKTTMGKPAMIGQSKSVEIPLVDKKEKKPKVKKEKHELTKTKKEVAEPSKEDVNEKTELPEKKEVSKKKDLPEKKEEPVVEEKTEVKEVVKKVEESKDSKTQKVQEEVISKEDVVKDVKVPVEDK